MLLDSTMLLLIPALLLSVYAQVKVSSSFSKFSKVRSSSRISGKDAAEKILATAGIGRLPIIPVSGKLTDHYDPINKRLGLSESVYNSDSVAAVSVAAHEVGHALQHSEGYMPIIMRNRIFPIAHFGSGASWIMFLIGLFLNSGFLIQVGIAIFTFAVLFHVVTLPVEINASKRGLRALSDSGILTASEIPMAKKVLTAAALTYVASAVMAMLQLIRMLMLSRR